MLHTIYIASTLANAPRVRRIRDQFRDLGISLTYDWTEHNGGELFIPDDQPDTKRAVAVAELDGVMAAGVVLVVLPGGRGTHFEFGAAYAVGKPVVILADEGDDRNPSFYYLDNITTVMSEEEAIAAVVKLLHVAK